METEIFYKGFTIKIEPDEFINESPDDWGNDDCFLVYDHRDFYVKRDNFNPDDIFEAMQNKKALFNGYFYFPVFAYIHSGVALSLGKNSYPFTCPWDTSFKGFALVRKEKGCYTREKAYEIAQGLLNTWNNYLSGNVWNFVVKDKDGEVIDSCCNFYGDPEKSGCLEEAYDSVNCEIKRRLNKQITMVKTWIKNHVPLDIRQKMIAA